MGIPTGISLFTGGGGLDLAAGRAGVRTVAYVENDRYCQHQLQSRIRAGQLDDAPIHADVTTFDGRPYRGLVDLIFGGFPCQDVSVAGKRASREKLVAGARSGLWAHQARIIREVGPLGVLVENVPGLLTGGLGDVLGELAEMGYDARWEVLSAADVGAPHLRERVFVIAFLREALAHPEVVALGARLRADESRGLWRGRSGDGRGTCPPDCEGCAEERGWDLWPAQGSAPDAERDALRILGERDGQQQGEPRPSEPGRLREAFPDSEDRGLAMRGRSSGEGRHPLRGHLPPEGVELGDAAAGGDGPVADADGLGREAERAEHAGQRQPPERGPEVADADRRGLGGRPHDEQGEGVPDEPQRGRAGLEPEVSDADGGRLEGQRLAEPAGLEGAPGDLADGCDSPGPDAPHAPHERDVRWDGELRADEEAGRIRRDNGEGATPDDGREWWSTEPPLGRVVNGLAHRVDRLRLCGNGVVPAQAFPFFEEVVAYIKIVRGWI